jgi:hypothetical protein
MVARLERIWQDCPAATRAQGADWYPAAERIARAIAAEGPPGIGPARAAAVIAALSPRTRWADNLAYARAALRAAQRAYGSFLGDLALEGLVWTETEPYGLTDGRRKAIRILAGERPLDVLGGPKTRAFFRNITGDTRAVTVDVWAARAACGRWQPTPPNGRRYERIARAYQAAADRLGLEPRTLQAAVWIHVRGSHT